MSFVDDLTDEQLDQMGDVGATIRENRILKAKILAEARAKGDWQELLMMAESQERAPILLETLQAVDDERARTFMAEWFNSTEAFGDLAPAFREQFDRLGFVTDDDDGKMPDLPVTVYRAQWEKDPEPTEALAWSVRRDVAERFAHYITSVRARLILGIHREDDEPVIWQATAHEAYAWFVSRDEEEIVPKVLTDLRMISRLITVPKEEA